jgi:hypothetical protein
MNITKLAHQVHTTTHLLNTGLAIGTIANVVILLVLIKGFSAIINETGLP